MPSRFPFRATLFAAILVASSAVPVIREQARAAGQAADYLREPAGGGEDGRCDWFARLRRFTDETKRDCDDGRAVKPGPITSSILDRCRTEQGTRYDRLPIDDLIEGFSRQVQVQGLGNACHEIKQQAWDLIAQ